MSYVTVLFPCPGTTYTQGKHRAVCVDDCQQWPFIICQASVLWGGKYTQWIMVVLVCRRNPTWQPAEGRDKIIYEEIVYHGHGKHCPSHMRRAMDLRLWRGGAWIEDIWELNWRHERCNSMRLVVGGHNIIIVFLLWLFCQCWNHPCAQILVYLPWKEMGYGRDDYSYQTQGYVFLVKKHTECSGKNKNVSHNSKISFLFAFVVYFVVFCSVSYQVVKWISCHISESRNTISKI